MSVTELVAQVVRDHPVGAGIITIVLILAVAQTMTLPFKALNRWMRHKNIASAGWPPPHLDADGDQIEQNESSDWHVEERVGPAEGVQ